MLVVVGDLRVSVGVFSDTSKLSGLSPEHPRPAGEDAVAISSFGMSDQSTFSPSIPIASHHSSEQTQESMHGSCGVSKVGLLSETKTSVVTRGEDGGAGTICFGFQLWSLDFSDPYPRRLTLSGASAEGQPQARLRRMHLAHIGCFSSHFTFFKRQVLHPEPVKPQLRFRSILLGRETHQSLISPVSVLTSAPLSRKRYPNLRNYLKDLGTISKGSVLELSRPMFLIATRADGYEAMSK